MALRTLAAWTLPLAAAFAQSPAAFEVASVKPTGPAQKGLHKLNCASGAEFVAWDMPLLVLVSWAYEIPTGNNRIAGGPPWINSPDAGFHIEAKPARKIGLAECRTMLQSLLAERFQLAVHRETRELPVYLLTSIGESKLRKTADDPTTLSSVTINGDELQFANGYARTASGRGMSMAEFTGFLTRMPVIGRTVIDRTGLEGYYGFHLDYAETLDDTTRPDIFAAVREQLGVKLDVGKAPVEVLVIDRAERPTAN